ncbi:histidine phosphatase family protein [Bacillus coreaensis]
MKKIYLTRHGETEWNRVGRLQGWCDSLLTEKGKGTRPYSVKGLTIVNWDGEQFRVELVGDTSHLEEEQQV